MGQYGQKMCIRDRAIAAAGRFGRREAGGGPTIPLFAIFTLASSGREGAVSYTHLDVYKRQEGEGDFFPGDGCGVDRNRCIGK